MQPHTKPTRQWNEVVFVAPERPIPFSHKRKFGDDDDDLEVIEALCKPFFEPSPCPSVESDDDVQVIEPPPPPRNTSRVPRRRKSCRSKVKAYESSDDDWEGLSFVNATVEYQELRVPSAPTSPCYIDDDAQDFPSPIDIRSFSEKQLQMAQTDQIDELFDFVENFSEQPQPQHTTSQNKQTLKPKQQIPKSTLPSLSLIDFSGPIDDFTTQPSDDYEPLSITQ